MELQLERHSLRLGDLSGESAKKKRGVSVWIPQFLPVVVFVAISVIRYFLQNTFGLRIVWGCSYGIGRLFSDLVP